MNVFKRLWLALIHDITEEPEEEPIGEQEEVELKSGWECRWLEVHTRCRSPMGDGEGMLPSGCDANCPARVQAEYQAKLKAIENTERIYT